MQIHHRLQVAPLPLLRSGGLLVPTPLPRVSPRVLLGYRRLLLSLQQRRSPPIGLSLFTLMHDIHHLIWIYANVAMVPRQRKNSPPPPLSSPFIFPALFLFVSFPNCCLLCCVGTSYGGPDLLCHMDLFKRVVRVMIVNYRAYIIRKVTLHLLRRFTAEALSF